MVVADSALAEDDWIPVDPATFATKFPGVYAVLIAQINNAGAPPPYDGASAC